MGFFGLDSHTVKTEYRTSSVGQSGTGNVAFTGDVNSPITIQSMDPKSVQAMKDVSTRAIDAMASAQVGAIEAQQTFGLETIKSILLTGKDGTGGSVVLSPGESVASTTGQPVTLSGEGGGMGATLWLIIGAAVLGIGALVFFLRK